MQNLSAVRGRGLEIRLSRRGLVVLLLTLVVVGVLPRHVGGPSVHDVACIFSGLGNLLFLSLGYGTLIGFACWRRAWADLKFVVAVAVITTVIVQGTKLLIGVWTPRPSGAHGGFPSGHAASSFALATLLAYQFPRLSLLWYGIAAVISWSRVETNAHWYYQVAVGAVLGFLLPLYTARRFRISQSDAG